MTEKILVIGSGFLGSYLEKQIEKNGMHGIFTHYDIPKNNTIRVDIRDVESISNCVTKVKPDFIINCAAKTQLDFLETNPEIAYAINSYGAKNVATIAEKNKTRLIHISSDIIFDGINGIYTEKDLPNPINVYAKSKVLAEEFVRDHCNNYVIVRTNFYGMDPSGGFFFNWILKNLKENKQSICFYDFKHTQLEVSNLCEMLLELANKKFNGIINLASDNVISRYQFAIQVAEIFNLNKDLIKKDSIDNSDFIAKRPKDNSLSNKLAKQLLSTPIISLQDWLVKIKDTMLL